MKKKILFLLVVLCMTASALWAYPVSDSIWHEWNVFISPDKSFASMVVAKRELKSEVVNGKLCISNLVEYDTVQKYCVSLNARPYVNEENISELCIAGSSKLPDSIFPRKLRFFGHDIYQKRALEVVEGNIIHFTTYLPKQMPAVEGKSYQSCLITGGVLTLLFFVLAFFMGPETRNNMAIALFFFLAISIALSAFSLEVIIGSSTLFLFPFILTFVDFRKKKKKSSLDYMLQDNF
ncbi:MAG TPA: hypothetical protein PKZ36_03050 [Candidatus Paceibacterota bacterium]|nr:hypothetical protein [Candidatus Paceibacterota bacterium]HPT18357.1 hypothetical protein [Candidatus Paceibacterota bacterium]